MARKKKITGWGGAREGAGRPPEDPDAGQTITRSFSLKQRHLDALDRYRERHDLPSGSKALQAILDALDE